MKEVFIMSKQQVESADLFRIPVLSILSPGVVSAQFQNPGRVEERRFWDSDENGSIPSFEARGIFEFLEAHRDVERMIVHCEQGISRSAAVALFCAERYGSNVDMRGKRPNLELVRLLRQHAQDHDRFAENG